HPLPERERRTAWQHLGIPPQIFWPRQKILVRQRPCRLRQVIAREIRLSAGAQVRLGIRLCTASALGAFQMRELRTFGKSRRASHTPTSLAQPRGPIFSPRNEPPEASAARRFTVQCI